MGKSLSYRKFTLGLLTHWRSLGMPFSDAVLVLAVSGGADSCALTCAVADLTKRGKLANDIILANFDHRLRGEGGKLDSGFVRELAGRYGFRFAAGEAAGPGPEGDSNVEQAARIARYRFLRDVAVKAGARAVLTAHTVDDQAETVLMHLIRGSGIEGLAAMRPVRAFTVCEDRADWFGEGSEGSGREAYETLLLVRPMLRWATRADTESFSRSCGVEYRMDPMNEDLRFTRVRIRKQVIPMLKELNPNVVGVLSKSSEIFSEDAVWVDSLARREAGKLLDIFKPEISLEVLKSMPASMAHRVIRLWLVTNRGGIRGLARRHVEAVGRLAVSEKSGRLVELPHAERVLKRGGKLVFERPKVDK